jgi:hypothetical protein
MFQTINHLNKKSTLNEDQIQITFTFCLQGCLRINIILIAGSAIYNCGFKKLVSKKDKATID